MPPVSQAPYVAPKFQKAVSHWLLLCLLLIGVMVIIGGYTRLSGSGLSITEWKPIHGTIPPMNILEWQEEFAKYKAIPQYRQVNKGMSLNEFKAIYWPEFWHRNLGRLIGLVFALPLFYFTFRRAFSRTFTIRLMAILMLGGAQGLIGWIMVASGLQDRIYVHHLKLSIHFGMAMLLASAIWWTWLDVLFTRRVSKNNLHPASGEPDLILHYASESDLILHPACGGDQRGGFAHHKEQTAHKNKTEPSPTAPPQPPPQAGWESRNAPQAGGDSYNLAQAGPENYTAQAGGEPNISLPLATNFNISTPLAANFNISTPLAGGIKGGAFCVIKEEPFLKEEPSQSQQPPPSPPRKRGGRIEILRKREGRVEITHKRGRGNLGLFALITLLIFTQLVVGAMVAGLHAGLIYNTFPLMNGHWIAPDVFNYQGSWFDHVPLIQFIHRWMAKLIVVLAALWWFLYYRPGAGQHPEPQTLTAEQPLTYSSLRWDDTAVKLFFAALFLQFTLGVLTLMNAVPITYAMLHQIGGVLLLLAALAVLHAMKKADNKSVQPG